MTASTRYPLIVATDRLPLSTKDCSSIALARAQGPLMQAVAVRDGAWVAASAGETKASLWLNPVYPPPDTLSEHRDGYCANTLASVYFGHDGAVPAQRPEWAAAHRSVSQQYAHHIADLAAPGALVWIHDYPLQLVPGMLRDLRPDLRIGYSLHSAFPASGTLLTVAEHDQILSSLLATDLVNFSDIRSAASFTGYAQATGFPPTRTTVMPIPAETHTITQLANSTSVRTQAARIRHRLRPANTILLAMGGSDPGDGVLPVLLEYQQLLAAGDLDPKSTVLIYLARPGGVMEDDQSRQDTERLIAQINGNYAVLGHLPVQHQRGLLTPAERVAFYLATDVMLAAPTRDRASFEAVEYVTARSDGTGRLVLSEFSTASVQLTAAKPFNPHLPGVLAEAMIRATRYAKSRSANMVAMREHALGNTISGWAEAFLHQLARTASRGQVSGETVPIRQAQLPFTQPNGTSSSRFASTGSHP